MMNLPISLKTIIICILLLTSTFGFSQPAVSSGEQSFELIIVAPEEFTTELERLATHKQDLGISTNIVTIENIINGTYNQSQGYDDAEQLKYFLDHAYKQWNTRYVLLAGGKDRIPVRYSHINIENDTNGILHHYRFIDQNPIFSFLSAYISDLYYADLYFQNTSFCSWDSNNNHIYGEKNMTALIDTVDLYPDIAIGRLLCNTTEDLSIVINKILTYETNNDNTAWFQNMVLCGGDTHPTFSDLMVKLLLGEEKNLSIAYEGEYMGNQVETMLPSFITTKVYASGFLNHNSLPLTKENMQNSINQGCGFLFLAGHGYPEAWGTHPPTLFGKLWLPKPLLRPSFYSISDVNQLTNQEKLPVTVVSACSCGDFNATDCPFAWSFVQHEQGGAIGSFACTTLGTLLPTTLCASTMNGKLSLGIFEAYEKGTKRLGDIWKYSITAYLDDPDAMNLLDIDGLEWVNNFNLEEWILFGDPTLQVGGYN